MKHAHVTLADVADYGNLLIASAQARKGKSHYRSVVEFLEDKDNLLHKLHDDLMSGNYHTSEYRVQTINDNGKERVISKLPFYPDRIVHWAIMLQLEQYFLNRFTEDTHAAIPEHGTHTALVEVRRAFYEDKKGTQWCLKLDVSKYFPHVNHAVLKGFVSNLVSDYGLRKLIYEIIDSVDEGIPIGNYLSQYLANLYLSKFDRWVHTMLKVKHYVRYMDDMVFFGATREELVKVFREVEWYLMRNLFLEVKPNWQIFNTDDRYLDFVGYKIKRNVVILRKRTWSRLRKRCRIISADKGYLSDTNRSSLMAYVGWAYHCSTSVRKRIFELQFKPSILLYNMKINNKMRKHYEIQY